MLRKNLKNASKRDAGQWTSSNLQLLQREWRLRAGRPPAVRHTQTWLRLTIGNHPRQAQVGIRKQIFHRYSFRGVSRDCSTGSAQSWNPLLGWPFPPLFFFFSLIAELCQYCWSPKPDTEFQLRHRQCSLHSRAAPALQAVLLAVCSHISLTLTAVLPRTDSVVVCATAALLPELLLVLCLCLYLVLPKCSRYALVWAVILIWTSSI